MKNLNYALILVFFLNCVPITGLIAMGGKLSAAQLDHRKHETPEQSSKEPPLKPAEGASVKILSPKEGEVISGDTVPLQFNLVKGKRGEHVHAYVDGELMGMFKSESGTLTGIKPGRRTLELRVVADDHETELDATDRVQFSVK